MANYSSVAPQGIDLRGTLEDIPLFWRSRIVEIKVAENIDEIFMLHKRNLAMHNMITQQFTMSYEQLSAKLPAAFLPECRVAGGKSYEENTFERVRGDNTVCCFRHNIKSSSSRNSIIILDFNFTCGPHFIPQLRKQLQYNSDFEIIWMNLGCRISCASPQVDSTADAILRYTFEKTYNKNAALNAATAIARGEIITYIELNFMQTIVNPKFINECRRDIAKMENSLDGSWLVRHVLHEQIFEGNPQKFSIMPHEVINCLTLPRKVVFEMGGFDECDFFNSNRGGLYDIYYRSQWAGVKEYISEKPYTLSLVSDKPRENVPFSIFEQRTFSKLRSLPIKKSPIFDNYS